MHIEDQKLDIKAQSKIGSFENVKHKPGGGEKKIFDDKEYLKQIGGGARKASSEHLASGSQGEDGYCSSSSTSRKTSRDRRQPSETRIERQHTPRDPKMSPRDEKKHIKDQHRSLKEKHIDKTQKSAAQKATTKEKEKENTDIERVDLSTENMNDIQASPDEQAADSTKSPTEDGEEMDLNSNQTSSEGHSEDVDKPVVKDKKSISETISNVKHHDVNGMDVEKPSDKSENEVISTEKDIKESVNKESKVIEKLKTGEHIEEHLEKEQPEKTVQSKTLEKSVEDDKVVQIEKETTERMEKDTTKIQEEDKPKTEKQEPAEETIQIKSEPKTETKSIDNANDLKNKTNDKDQHKVTTVSDTDPKLKESNNKIQISNTGSSEVHPNVTEISHSSEVQTSQKKESVGKNGLADSDVIKKDVPESTGNEKSSSQMKTVANNVETKEDLSLKVTECVEETDKGKTDPLVFEQKEKYTSLPASEGKTRTDSTYVQNADTDVSRKPNEIKQEDKSKLPGTHFDTNIIKTLEVSTTENQTTSKMSQNSKESKLGEMDMITNTELKDVGVSKLAGDARSPVVSEETKPDQSFKSNISSGTNGTGATVKEGIIMPQPDK